MKKKLTLIVLLVGVVLLAVGLSYAYFSAKITNNENTSTIISEAGTLSITLDGGASFNVGSILPGPDAWATKTITLTGNNSSKGNMPYSIKIAVDNNTFSTDAISYSITGTNTSNSGVVAPSVEYIPINSTTTIGSGFFEKGSNKVHTYTIRMYFLDTNTDQSSDMRATFNAHVEIVGEESEKPAPSGWWKASGSTLLAALRKNTVVHEDTDEGMTTPGQQINNGDEGLRKTLDDYGVSYYFRGAVENNYVIFANKCWRIVRITGNGAIKLILHNNDSSECDISDNSLNFAKYDGTNNLSYWIDDSEIYINNDMSTGYVKYTASGIGFMYGNANPSGNNDIEKYFDAQANLHDSTILKKIKQWYDYFDGNNIQTFTNTEKNLLFDIIWCNDKSLVSGVGYGITETVFGAWGRVSSPSLVCQNTGINGKLSKFSSNNNYGNKLMNGYKIGLLTADEVTFAGGKSFKTNDNYYLKNNYTYWTMSPYHFTDNTARVFAVKSGELRNLGVQFTARIRPSIALIPSVTITDTTQDGTIDNPYVIDEN